MLLKDLIKKLNKNGEIKVSPLVYVMNGYVTLSTTDVTIEFDSENNDFEIIRSDFTQKVTTIDKEFLVTNKLFSINDEIDNKKVTFKMLNNYLEDEIVDVTFIGFTKKENIKFYKGIGTINFICNGDNDKIRTISLIVKSAKNIPTGRLLPFN